MKEYKCKRSCKTNNIGILENVIDNSFIDKHKLFYGVGISTKKKEKLPREEYNHEDGNIIGDGHMKQCFEEQVETME